MDKTMLISIITPTYNREAFLPAAIESVLAQSYKEFELIIVDDGSTDNSRELINAYADKDPRVKYLYQENQRQSVARNYALSIAKGDFICFLDSDNYWPHDKLEKSLKAFEQHPEADIVYGDCITIDEQGNELHRNNMRRYSGNIAALLLKDNFVSMNTTMTRRKCFNEMGGMSGKRRVADDYDLWLKFSSRYRFQYIPEFLAYYRVMENQISSNKKLRFETNEKIILDFLAAYPDAVSEQEKKAGLTAFYTRKARHYAASDKKEAYKAIRIALGISPFSSGVWRSFAKIVVS
ncbi:glycosyltransferase family 2 protein [Cellvibrio sp. QJXJ]|uniref:glycosyltransferase family 2 protein n=1 Tax=Cellvibrio sp. QJXJ TaxID=2964606 RepID=UPI0021C29904|nr:glycosyltransferase [Cellvibrio sp. QJXJ]UUA71389.1 glycosyltransferase [Cellvibrio sp. QJXJ]